MTSGLPPFITRRSFAKLAAGTPLALAALTKSAAAATNWSLYIHQSAPQFSTSLGAKRFVEEVSKATGDDLKIRLHLAGTLQIAPTDITQAVSDNIVQMGDDMFFAGNVPVGGMLRLPFLIQSHEDFLKASPVILPYVKREYAKKGVTVLGTYDYPMTYVWSRSKLTSLADMKGLKVRVPSPEVATLMQKLGVTPISIAASEVPVALDRGVVDAVVTGVLGAALWKDLLRFGYLLPTGSINVYYIANTSALERLTPSQRSGLERTVADAMQWNTKTNIEVADNDQKNLASSGKMTISRPSSEEIKIAENAAVDIWTNWAQQTGPDAINALKEVRLALGR